MIGIRHNDIILGNIPIDVDSVTSVTVGSRAAGTCRVIDMKAVDL